MSVGVEEEVLLLAGLGLTTRHETLQRLCYSSSHVISSLHPSAEVETFPVGRSGMIVATQEGLIKQLQ